MTNELDNDLQHSERDGFGGYNWDGVDNGICVLVKEGKWGSEGVGLSKSPLKVVNTMKMVMMSNYSLCTNSESRLLETERDVFIFFLV